MTTINVKSSHIFSLLNDVLKLELPDVIKEEHLVDALKSLWKTYHPDNQGELVSFLEERKWSDYKPHLELVKQIRDQLDDKIKSEVKSTTWHIPLLQLIACMGNSSIPLTALKDRLDQALKIKKYPEAIETSEIIYKFKEHDKLCPLFFKKAISKIAFQSIADKQFPFTHSALDKCAEYCPSSNPEPYVKLVHKIVDDTLCLKEAPKKIEEAEKFALRLEPLAINSKISSIKNLNAKNSRIKNLYKEALENVFSMALKAKEMDVAERMMTAYLKAFSHESSTMISILREQVSHDLDWKRANTIESLLTSYPTKENLDEALGILKDMDMAHHSPALTTALIPIYREYYRFYGIERLLELSSHYHRKSSQHALGTLYLTLLEGKFTSSKLTLQVQLAQIEKLDVILSKIQLNTIPSDIQLAMQKCIVKIISAHVKDQSVEIAHAWVKQLKNEDVRDFALLGLIDYYVDLKKANQKNQQADLYTKEIGAIALEIADSSWRERVIRSITPASALPGPVQRLKGKYKRDGL